VGAEKENLPRHQPKDSRQYLRAFTLRFTRCSDWCSKKAYRVWGLQNAMNEWFPTKGQVNAPGKAQKSQPSKKLAPALVSTKFQSEVGVGAGVPPEEDVGLGRLELEEPDVMDETMTLFPPPVEFPPPVGVGDVLGFVPWLLATQ